MKKLKRNVILSLIIAAIALTVFAKGVFASGTVAMQTIPTGNNATTNSAAGNNAVNLNGNVAKATQMQLEAINLIDALFCEVNPIPVKAAMNMMGLNAGPMRLPLCEMSAEHQATLRRTMEEVGLV